MQEKSLAKSKNNSVPKEKYFLVRFLLACHFGSRAAKTAILAVTPTVVGTLYLFSVIHPKGG
jgi:hypothetical protein